MLEGHQIYRVSVDIGGTFTDLVAMDEDTGKVLNIKVPTIPKNPEKGVVEGFIKFLVDNDPESVGMVSHATTIATNALFGQVDLELPKTALITTRGFRDVIEIGRQRRAEVYNLFFQRPPMLVERRHRHEVRERVDHQGHVLEPLIKVDLQAAIKAIQGEGIKSIAVGFINSYLNQAHEKEVLRAISQALPGVHCTASSLISSGYREYERFSTTVVNAVLIPIIQTYVRQLASDLKGLGIASPLYVMQSNGGMATAEFVSERPATIVESGPASGVIASAWLGELMGKDEVVSFDMGGTTAKAGTIRGMTPEVVQEYEVAGTVHMGRLLKGSGYPVRFPFIDLAECSAGGGTIAWVDEGSALNVGPLSAGAEPGPACYDRGGDDLTITDANLILGRLNPQNLLGGDMKIFPDLSMKAAKNLGEKIGQGPEEVAASVVKLADSMMSKILRIVSVERGYDPRRFTLVAFGGAGPMHACSLAEELEIDEIIIPSNPGMFSALGLLTADLFHDFSRAFLTKLDEADETLVEKFFKEMEDEGREVLASEGVKTQEMRFQRSLDLRYFGQSYEITVDYSEEGLPSTVARTFHERHREIYGYEAMDEPVELVNLRLRAVGVIPKPSLEETLLEKGAPILLDQRSVYFEEPDGWIETPIFERESLGSGIYIEGPAVIEQYDSTTVIHPGWTVETGSFGVLVLRRVA